MTKAILFDLDETLLDRTVSFENYIESQYHRHKLEHLEYKIYRDRFIELDARGYADRQKLFETLIKEFDLALSIEEMLIDFGQKAWKKCQTFPGASEVLQELRRRGYKLGIITNGSTASQSVKLSESGLDLLVDVILISEQEQVKKPDPVIFMRAAERLGVSVTECVFVGDHPEVDIDGASRIDMKTVWLRGRQPGSGELTSVPDYIIDSLSELLSIRF